MIKKLSVRSLKELQNNRFNDEDFPTTSSHEQEDVEESVSTYYRELHLSLKLDKNLPELHRRQHIIYLNKSLFYLSSKFQSLDASRSWICYWILHTLTLLEAKIPYHWKSAIIKFLKKCQSPTGGFCGGPGHDPHLAPTYAAVNALVILGSQEAYDAIDRINLLKFLWSLKEPDGSFRMHRDGEVDIRGIYCALSAATLSNIDSRELFEGTAEWIASCQTYEGGFAGCPGMEAHGGYAFCGLAALIMLKKAHLCDSQSLLRWLVNRQMKFEGGFQGRTNKLVDGCYSFWQGGAFPLIHTLLTRDGFEPDEYLFNSSALQEYILICCQSPDGGLVDKPGKPRDVYHTCYTMSGLSIAQHFQGIKSVLGRPENEVAQTHPIFNIRIDFVRKALLYFSSLPTPSQNGDMAS